MRYARALVTLLFAVVALAASPQRAEAVTLKEIIELTKANVSDDVILALIEIDQRVFPIDTETLALLKQEGVSARVMVAIVKSGRTRQAQADPGPLVQGPVDPPPPPRVYVVEREPSTVREVVVPVPVYVAVPTARSGYGRRSVTSYDSIKTPFNPFGPLPSTALPPVTSSHPAPKHQDPSPEPSSRSRKQ